MSICKRHRVVHWRGRAPAGRAVRQWQRQRQRGLGVTTCGSMAIHCKASLVAVHEAALQEIQKDSWQCWEQPASRPSGGSKIDCQQIWAKAATKRQPMEEELTRMRGQVAALKEEALARPAGISCKHMWSTWHRLGPARGLWCCPWRRRRWSVSIASWRQSKNKWRLLRRHRQMDSRRQKWRLGSTSWPVYALIVLLKLSTYMSARFDMFACLSFLCVLLPRKPYSGGM